MANVIAFGRKNGAVVYKYGPKSFSADWGGVFTALDIIDGLTKIPITGEPLELASGVVGSIATEPSPTEGIPERAQKLNAKLLLRDFEFLAPNIGSLLISVERKSWIKSNSVNALCLRFWADKGKRPSLQLQEALAELGLSSWGYVNEIVTALRRFDSDARGSSGMTVSFTV